MRFVPLAVRGPISRPPQRGRRVILRTGYSQRSGMSPEYCPGKRKGKETDREEEKEKRKGDAAASPLRVVPFSSQPVRGQLPDSTNLYSGYRLSKVPRTRP